MKVCGRRVRLCEVGNETSSSVEFVEIFDRSFPAPEGFCYNKLDAINNLILLCES